MRPASYALAGVIYAVLMTLWNYFEGDPFRGSYVLGFVLYATVFAVGFGLLMETFHRLKAAKDDYRSS